MRIRPLTTGRFLFSTGKPYHAAARARSGPALTGGSRETEAEIHPRRTGTQQLPEPGSWYDTFAPKEQISRWRYVYSPLLTEQDRVALTVMYLSLCLSCLTTFKYCWLFHLLHPWLFTQPSSFPPLHSLSG